MVDVPPLTAVTKPELVIVAMLVFDEVHGFEVAAVALPVNVSVFPAHMGVLPVTVGKGFTLTVIVFEQPLLLVYVMIAVPAEIPVTNPVLDTLAIDVLEEDHALLTEGEPDPDN